MLPWNYGFQWNTETVIFLGAFYTVLATVAGAVLKAAVRARRALGAQGAEQVRWHADFHDLPAADRVCRHVLTGAFKHRECPNAFDCRKCETHRRLTKHNSPQFGNCVACHRITLYHRGHTWVRAESDGMVTVGLDGLGQRLLANPERVYLPEPGQRVCVNGIAWRVRKREADVRILSPVDGEVIETGGPGRPWYLKVKPESADFRHLLSGDEVTPWTLREMERLQVILAAEVDWDTVCGRMFLQP